MTKIHWNHNRKVNMLANGRYDFIRLMRKGHGGCESFEEVCLKTRTTSCYEFEFDFGFDYGFDS